MTSELGSNPWVPIVSTRVRRTGRVNSTGDERRGAVRHRDSANSTQLKTHTDTGSSLRFADIPPRSRDTACAKAKRGPAPKKGCKLVYHSENPFLRPPQAKKNFRTVNAFFADNSALISVYQMGAMDLTTNARLAFLHHLIKEPALNELRTNEQLGYIVHTSIKTSGDNIKGLLFLIQSDAYDPIHLDERVEAFLERFRTRLVDMEAEEFDTNIQAVKKNFLEKNKNLGEESSKYWSVITDKSYVFRKWTIIGEEVGKITKDEVLEFFDKFVAAGAPFRSKIATQVCAKQHESTVDAPVPEGAVLINDPQTFQKEMPLFPLRPKVDVAD